MICLCIRIFKKKILVTCVQMTQYEEKNGTAKGTWVFPSMLLWLQGNRKNVPEILS